MNLNSKFHQDSDNGPKESQETVDPVIAIAVNHMIDFVETATGKRPEPEEIAGALSKYFVRKEILDFIKLARNTESEDS